MNALNLSRLDRTSGLSQGPYQTILACIIIGIICWAIFGSLGGGGDDDRDEEKGGGGGGEPPGRRVVEQVIDSLPQRPGQRRVPPSRRARRVEPRPSSPPRGPTGDPCRPPRSRPVRARARARGGSSGEPLGLDPSSGFGGGRDNTSAVCLPRSTGSACRTSHTYDGSRPQHTRAEYGSTMFVA